MKIDENILNANIEYCIDEYVRNITHRQILRDKWFYGLSLKELADKYKMSDTSIRRVVYDTGDKILIRARGMDNTLNDTFLVKLAVLLKSIVKEPPEAVQN